MKKEKPKFYAMCKDFNTGKVEYVEVLERILYNILTKNNTINKKNFFIWDKDSTKVPITTKEQLKKFLDDELRYYFWSKCEWEIIAIDWPYRDNSIRDSCPIKFDVYYQLKPNLDIITNLVWDYVEPKIK